ncbi:indolepyruvate oxidoreductase subunit beta [Thermohalobacter berrensis]|uniref:Pyruvate ferredoxin oxidoreductase n=1 Tax=Thermohalobacter berrensis TaxID=99594 RepID=A0A419SWC6_9FIRM|nr:indolepyruvate oxidoreductase subunit beta [Thermohalobacter berrensis]RKD29534.1 pyruvate ferredoxin oxidoreductase [Thermohalobacter berrensis]
MINKNIILAGVGGQGLVLTTKLICEAALKAGYDVKSNDVIGLAQRGGRVWGSVRIGKKVYSPNIPPKSGDILLALEPLEGLRWSGILKEKAKVIINISKIPPAHVMAEKEKYPGDIEERLSKKYDVITINATDEGKLLGTPKVANTILVGIMAKYLDIPMDIWEEAIKENVPSKYIDTNMKAFKKGYDM